MAIRTTPYRRPARRTSGFQQSSGGLFGSGGPFGGSSGGPFPSGRAPGSLSPSEIRANILAGMKNPDSDAGFQLHDLTDWIPNVAEGAETLARGFLPGVWETAQTNPLTTLENVAGDYGDRYGDIGGYLQAGLGPLLPLSILAREATGKDAFGSFDAGEFASKFEDNPLPYILDVLTAGTGAGAIAGKVARTGILGKAVKDFGSVRDETFMVGRGEFKVPHTMELSGNPFTRLQQRAGVKLLNRVPARVPVAGRDARVAKEGVRAAEFDTREGAGLLAHMSHAMTKSMPDHLRVAYGFAKRGITDRATLERHLTKQEQAGVLAPKGRELAEMQMTPDVERVLTDIRHKRMTPEIQQLREWDDLVEKSNAYTARVGGIPAERVMMSDLRHAQEVDPIMVAAPKLTVKRDRVGVAQPHFGSIPAGRRRSLALTRWHSVPRAERATYRDWAVHVDENPNNVYEMVGTDVLGKVQIREYTPDGKLTGQEWIVSSKLVRRLRSGELTAKGESVKNIYQERTGWRPGYQPDRPFDVKEFGKASQGRSGLKLFRGGVVNYDTVNSLYDLQAGVDAHTTAGLKQFLHDNVAQSLPHNRAVPPGWAILRPMEPNVPSSRMLASNERTIRELDSKSVAERAKELWKDVTTTDRSLGATDEAGNTLIVPSGIESRLGSKIAYEEGTPGAYVAKFNQIFKTIALSLSPARFLGTNVVGNLAFQALRDPASLDELIRVSVRRGFKDNGIIVGGETKTLYDNFGHQTVGLGIAERADELSHRGARRKFTKITNVGYHVVGYTEEAQRESLVVKMAMREPVIRAEVMRLKGEGYVPTPEMTTLNRAMQNVFKDEGAFPEGRRIHRRIALGVDRAMGDYRNFTKREKHIRLLIPFYSWLRHAARTTGVTTLEKPGTMNVVANISEQRKDIPGLPSFMTEYVDAPSFVSSRMGGDDPDAQLQHFINLQPFNPFSTVADELGAVNAVLAGDPGKLQQGSTSGLGPLVSGSIEFLTGESLLSGAPLKDEPFGLGTGFVGNVIARPLSSVGPLGVLKAFANQPDLLQDTLEERYDAAGRKRSAPQRLFNPDPRYNVAGYLGFPVRQIDLDVAGDMYRQEQGIKKPRKRTTKVSSPFKGLAGLGKGAYGG